MESLILRTINFDVSVPTVLNFLERFVKATECSDSDSPKVEALAKVTSCTIISATDKETLCGVHAPFFSIEP